MTTRTSPTTFQQALPQALLAIRQAARITILSHYNPDPDAYGSSCGLALTLREAGKSVSLLNADGVDPRLAFIPGVSEVSQTPPSSADLLIVCDCGDIGRVGDALVPYVSSHAQVINLDHHTSNDLFGSVHLVDETASSSSELVVRLISALALPIPKSAATALYAGMCADTGSFRYSSTSAVTLETAAQLVRAGASPHAISESLYSSSSLAGVRLQALSLARLRMFEGNKVCVLVITPEMLVETGATSDDSEGLAEKGRDIEGVQVSALIRWSGDLWRVSMRSRSAAWNVSEVAQEFGGGGHKVAAAFRWRNPREELEGRLIPRLCALVQSAPVKNG